MLKLLLHDVSTSKHTGLKLRKILFLLLRDFELLHLSANLGHISDLSSLYTYWLKSKM